MNYRLLIIITCFSILISCAEKEVIVPVEKEKVEESIFAIWKRKNIERNYENQKDEDAAKRRQGRDHKDFFINIFPDGRGTIIYNTEIDTFAWQVDESNGTQDTIKSIVAKLPFGQTKINFLNKKGSSSLVLSTDSGLTKMNFTHFSPLTTDFKEDPFYADNNRWRIRKLDMLSESEMESKVENYLQHYLYLFKAALDEDNPRNFSNRNSKGVFRVYKSSIGISAKNEISEDWYSYFYNEEEAVKAYDLIKKRIKNSGADIEKSDKWQLDNYKILQGITSR
ncbi:hypothetical protein [Portibacter lacus]|uniref:Lipoprotein n=1 Tax=Portibacter lacus TaxID=1099794 RepID=A0AA37SM93_9BACT|nr:hypothetical protein [Portibacter lacus]GLR17258.1 hypothetical protein GCM10007940_18730 [Portibacter lacus]